MYHQSPPATFSHQIMNKITFLDFLKTLITISISSSASHHNHHQHHHVHRQYMIIFIITGRPNLCLIWPVSLLLRNSSETGESSGVCRETINKIINNFIWFLNTNLIRTRTRMLIRLHQFPTQCVVAAWTRGWNVDAEKLDASALYRCTVFDFNWPSQCWCIKTGCSFCAAAQLRSTMHWVWP